MSLNLKVVSETQAKKIMAELATGENPALMVKQFGKVDIYWQNQSVYPDVDAESVKRVDAEIAATRIQLAEAQSDAKELAAESAALGSTLPIAEIDRRVAALEQKTAAQAAKIAALRGGSGEQVSRAAFQQAEQTLQRALKAWRLRKKMAKEIVDDMAESGGQKPAEIRDEHGIEDDAAVGQDIARFAKYDKPAATLGKRGPSAGFAAQPNKK